MGAAGSRNVRFDEAQKSFNKRERDLLADVFEKLSVEDIERPGKKVIEFDQFKDHVSWLLPEDIAQRFFKEMLNVQKPREATEEPSKNQVTKEALYILMFQVLKKSNEEKSRVIYSMTADADCIITSADIEKLLILMLNCYIMALKKTETGSKWGIETTQESNERFAKMTVKELLGSKPDPSFVPIEEVHSWLGKVPLVGQLFEDVLTACIMNPECVLEGAHHGISEGCEETVEHVEYNKMYLDCLVHIEEAKILTMEPKWFDREVKEAIYIRALHPSLNHDGGRYNLPPVYNNMITRSNILVPCKLGVDFSEVSTLLDIPSILMINHHLPTTCRHQWRLLFSSRTHGESFQAFVHQIVNQGPTVLVVKDTEGYLFGGFAAESWSVKSHFQGTNQCFLFTLSPSMAVYQPTEYNGNYMYLNMGMQTMPNGLGMGGQWNYFGLWLDESFGPGHSKAEPQCTTYGSPRLSKEVEFNIHTVEVWGVGIPPETKLKEQSVLDTDVEAKAFLEIAGKKMHSDGYRELKYQE